MNMHTVKKDKCADRQMHGDIEHVVDVPLETAEVGDEHDLVDSWRAVNVEVEAGRNDRYIST